MSVIRGFAHPAGHAGGSGGHGDDDENWRSPSTEEQWYMVNKWRPGEMEQLYQRYVEALFPPPSRRSLLERFYTLDADLTRIFKGLFEGSLEYYTQKLNSVFLHYFETESPETCSQYENHNQEYVQLGAHDNSEQISVQLGTIDISEQNENSYDPASHNVEHLLRNKKAIQLVLFYNKLLGKDLTTYPMPADTIPLEGADSKALFLAPIMKKLSMIFNNAFKFTHGYGVNVVAVCSKGIPNSGGRPDFQVKVDAQNKGGSQERPRNVTEYMLMAELETPNAGFWIAWKLLTGQQWSEEELSAFFKLQTLPCDSKSRFLSKWQVENASQWESARDVLDRVGSGHVEATYNVEVEAVPKEDTATTTEDTAEDTTKDIAEDTEDIAEDTTEDTAEVSRPEKKRRIEKESEEKQTISGDMNAKTSTEKTAGQKMERSYFVRTKNENREDITAQLEGAKFKNCMDAFHDALARVTQHAVLSNCSRVVIADGLTFIAGSPNNLEVSRGASNPTANQDVLDVHLHRTCMMQTHDRDSALHMLNLSFNSAMESSRLRCLGYQLLLDAGIEEGGEIAQPSEVKERMKKHRFVFDSQYHCQNNRELSDSSKLITRTTRMAVSQALDDIADMFKDTPGFTMHADRFTSDTFVVIDWFRESIFEGVGSRHIPLPGRSKSVAKVVFDDNTSEKYYVLKEYFGDKASISRMKRELEAYARISGLGEHNKQHFAQLVAFGSLDLDEGIPRLFLLTEYVDEPESGARSVPTDSGTETAEVAKVHGLLQSVGVCHNDLFSRNYKWQERCDGTWFIKVFDFDHATFKEPSV